MSAVQFVTAAILLHAVELGRRAAINVHIPGLPEPERTGSGAPNS
jgi:hypothetical protein